MGSVQKMWRLMLVFGWIAVGLMLAAVATLGARFRPQHWTLRRRQQLTGWWLRGLTSILPLRIHVQGKPTPDTALWVSNHVSWLDIAVLGAHSPLSFLSKSEVKEWPLIGWLASAAGTLFIRRGQSAGQALEAQLGSRLSSGLSLVLFAEGTTTAGDRVRAFHGRLFNSAIGARVPVQPVAIAYQRNDERDVIAPFIGDDAFHNHLWRLLGSERIDVRVQFLQPMASWGCTRNQLARATQSQVSQALGLRDETLKAVPSLKSVA